MSYKTGLALAAIAVGLGGCVTPPQPPVNLAQDSLNSQTGRLGVAMASLPKVDTEFPGASCLLCLAAANVANSSLTAHANTLPYEDLPKLKNEVADLIRKKKVDVIVIREDLKVSDLADFGTAGPNIARKDFSPLKQKYKIDKLLVIDITALGFIRTYSAYIPTSDPKSLLRGAGYIVNLTNNTYEWYLPVIISKSADKNWDEPPKFPGLTNAYFQGLELGKDRLLEPFVK
jgi:hypothetical protein